MAAAARRGAAGRAPALADQDRVLRGGEPAADRGDAATGVVRRDRRGPAQGQPEHLLRGDRGAREALADRRTARPGGYRLDAAGPLLPPGERGRPAHRRGQGVDVLALPGVAVAALPVRAGPGRARLDEATGRRRGYLGPRPPWACRRPG